MVALTRVFVLAGVVALVNSQDCVTRQANHLLAAEGGEAPVNPAVTTSGDFAVDLYRRLAKENQGKNLFFSPYAMSSALAMTAEGARGETAAQMGKVLCFPEAARHIGDDANFIPWNTAMIHSGTAALNERLSPKASPQELRDKIAALRKELAAINRRAAELDAAAKRKEFGEQAAKSQKVASELNALLAQVDQYELRVANALWGEKSYPFRQSYLDTVNKFYRTGGVFPVDFRHNSEGTRQQINAWVEEQTNKRINDLVPKGGVDGLTRLVLTNAIYFKGEWSEPFAESATAEGDFTVAAGTKVRVPMMHKDYMVAARYAAFNADGTFFPTPAEVPTFAQKKPDPRTLYPSKGGFVMAELSYKGGNLSMVVIVPQDADGLPELEKKLCGDNLQTWIRKLQSRPVNVHLPRFKLETGYKMKGTLSAMGMVRAFVNPGDSNGAQFDGMCASQYPRLKLFIGEVLHKAFVEVNEKGTEAAAAASVGMWGSFGIHPTEPFTPTFLADKSFVFAIRDVNTGTILFLGRMIDPKETQ